MARKYSVHIFSYIQVKYFVFSQKGSFGWVRIQMHAYPGDITSCSCYCSDISPRIPSVTACSLEGNDDVDRSPKSSDFYVNYLKTVLHGLGLLQFNVNVSF